MEKNDIFLFQSKMTQPKTFKELEVTIQFWLSRQVNIKGSLIFK